MIHASKATKKNKQIDNSQVHTTFTTNETAMNPNTRVCIKNLPPSFDENSVKKHLLSNSSNSNTTTELIITDCKLLRTKDGKSRKVAFVGFKTPEMATFVVNYFHQTFALTSKLSVDHAFMKKQIDKDNTNKDQNAEYRPWSKYSIGSSRYNNNNESKKESETNTNHIDVENIGQTQEEIKRDEFISTVMGNSRKKWSNDDEEMNLTLLRNNNSVLTHKNSTKQQDHHNSEISDNDGSNDDISNEDNDLDSVDSGGQGGDIITQSTKNCSKGEISDLDFLRSKFQPTKDILSDDDEDEKEETIEDKTVDEDDSSSRSSNSSESGENSSRNNLNPISTDTSSSNKSDTMIDRQYKNNDVDPCRLFVRNLPFGATEEDIIQAFAAHDFTVINCHIPIDDTKRNKGYAFVNFSTQEEATNALEKLDRTAFQGRLMHIIPARSENNSTTVESANMTHKQMKESTKQKNALNSSTGLSNYVRGDAVIDNLAQRLGLRKGDILNVKDELSSGNAAVRLALGETQIIEENRAYFKTHGIDMDALLLSSDNDSATPIKRSSTLILVKNLPYNVSSDDIGKLFKTISKDTTLPEILLPPSRTIALVEYQHPNDAKNAFRKLAYKRFKNVPLYLEWAPLLIKSSKEDEESLMRNEPDLAGDSKPSTHENIDYVEEVDSSSCHSVYVKNLNFTTTESSLRKLVEETVGKVRSVNIAMKNMAIKKLRGTIGVEETKRVSMGYGFIEFDSEVITQKAIMTLNGLVVDGHCIQVDMVEQRKKVSNPQMKGDDSKTKKKLVIRNVPFQASRKELLELFGTYGQLKNVRLPKKFDGSHRGFAFVEFLSSKEAQTAKLSLSQTHLYGRHLVLEWADDNEDVSSLREKNKRDEEKVRGKVSKRSKIEK